MAKSARAFQMPPEDQEQLPPPAMPPIEGAATAAPAPTVTASVNPDIGRPAYREGRKNLSVWLDAKAFNSFKAMVSQDGAKMSDYVIDMINREFARKGLPQIAKK